MAPVSPLFSRNARPQKALVGRAQWGTHPGHPYEDRNRASRAERWLVACCGLARGQGTSWRNGVGRVRKQAFLNSLLSGPAQRHHATLVRGTFTAEKTHPVHSGNRRWVHALSGPLWCERLNVVGRGY